MGRLGEDCNGVRHHRKRDAATHVQTRSEYKGNRSNIRGAASLSAALHRPQQRRTIMQRVWRLGGLAMVGMLGCMVAIAVAPPASAHVAPPASAWQNVVSFSLEEVFGVVPRTGTFDVNSCDPRFPTPFGFAFEGIATVNQICTTQVQENGGHAESWLIAIFTGAADVASINTQLMTIGLLQHNAQAFAVFTYGTSLGNGSFGTIMQ